MNIYTSTKFTGHWEVGVAAVVVAPSPEVAVAILNTRLEQYGLPGDAKEEDMKLMRAEVESVRILCDGNY